MRRYTNIDTGNNYLNEALENYLMHGFKPGGFLTSVLANDLQMAVSRADHWNRDNLPRIVDEIVWKMPNNSWGSYGAVNDWCNNVNGRQVSYAQRLEQEFTMRVLRSG